MPINIPTSAKVGIVSSKPNRFDLSSRHICTTDFGVIRPIFARMVVPADKMTASVDTLTRLDAMPSPSMADIKVHQRGFYVPFRTVCPSFNDFISNNVHFNAISQIRDTTRAIPYFTQKDFNDFMIARTDTSTGGIMCKKATSTDKPDYIVYDSSKAEHKLLLTPRGRQFMAILHGLGYNFDFNAGLDTNDIPAESLEYSALPLLCFIKIYLDWYVPAKFRFTLSEMETLQQILNRDWNALNTDNVLGISGNHIGSECLTWMCQFYSSFFTEDFYNNLTVEPFGNPTNLVNVYSGMIDNPAQLASPTLTEAQGATNDAGSAFNYFTLQSMGALQDMLNRNAIVSDKLIDYLKVEYGLTPNVDALGLSHYLGGNTDNIHIGDVMSMSDTFDAEMDKGALLGQYAGRGLGTQKSSFTCNASEYGMFIILQDIVVQPLYYEGVHEAVTSINRLDFFTPDFDMLGSQPIAMRNINCANTGIGLNPKSSPLSILGFAPQYADYKVGHDVISGNFRYASQNTGLNSWYIARNFADKSSDAKPNIANWNFADTSAFSIYNPFDSIFYSSSDQVDHFYQIHYIKCVAYRRMQSLIAQVLNEDDEKNGTVEISRSGTLVDRQ